jgi:outer membrane protein OmpA-like peptidoglycan-associated protein
MKKLSLLLLTAALLPGCKKKVKEEKKDEKSVNMPLASAGTQKGFFDEDINGFVMEEDTGAKKDESVLASADTKQFKTVHFEFDKYDIGHDQEPVVEADAQEALKVAREDQKTIVIEGHACHSAGSKAYNLLLSEHRAQEVAKHLRDAGVPDEQIKAVGRGTEMPVVMGGSREEQAPNRRVEIFPLQA